MNIQEAKQEIIHALRVYHKKDEYERYLFPQVKQRPIVLMGPPGIGKTAVMKQIAAECGIGLVSYTITHHTRQSAVGLPQIKEKQYLGNTVTVTEYTLSEILSSVYECMEKTGKTEGILFIDEINCVSETLAPTMLEFLQNKTFGNHKIPEGWMIVAAGNPQRYNKSAREYDIVTLDRIRILEIDADVDTWIKYAAEQNIHGAILSYLTIRKQDFYFVNENSEKKEYVTARGWEDLSELIRGYEEIDVPITEELISEYLQKRDVARYFASYYELYQKYGTDYRIDAVLEDKEPLEVPLKMAKEAPFDERMTVIGLILDRISEDLMRYDQMDRSVHRLRELVEAIQKRMRPEAETEVLAGFNAEFRKKLSIRLEKGLIDDLEASREEELVRMLERYDLQMKKQGIRSSEEQIRELGKYFDIEKEARRECITMLQHHLTNAFRFVNEAFGDDQEMLLLINGLLRNRRAVEFLTKHGNEAFLHYGRNFIPSDREELRRACMQAFDLNEAG